MKTVQVHLIVGTTVVTTAFENKMSVVTTAFENKMSDPTFSTSDVSVF